jgi:serine/threonine-protein kinase
VNDVDRLNDVQSTNVLLADQIDLICDAFEEEWFSGRVPRIEDYLHRCDPTAREQLLAELLLVDREFRVKQGESAGRQEYRQRFPDYSTVIDALRFDTIDDRMHNVAGTPVRAVPTAGAMIAQFELLEVLGSGASGIVWKARDTRLRRSVAIKLPRHESLSEAEKARFMREGRACAPLRHPNIVPLLEVGEHLGQLFIVTQFVDGVSLRAWLKEHRPKPREAAQIVAQLADALHEAHEHGVIHRDLKPANVLLDREGRPQITDFGLAKVSAATHGMTVEGEILGTPAYMSPEQARGEGFRVDRRSDVYGLGALLYEMLTGHPPFEGEIAAIVHQVIQDEPRLPRSFDPSLPLDLETICLKAMEKQAGRRYQTAEALAIDLHRYLQGQPILARRMSRLEKSWRWLRRRPSAVLATALGAMVVAAGAMIAGLVRENYALEGYRPVRVITEPAGARVALVPIDARTGEPNPDPSGIIRPRGMTPLTLLARPGMYLVEAVLPDDGERIDFAEVHLAIPEIPVPQVGRVTEYAGAVAKDLRIKIERLEEVVADMVMVTVTDELRKKNPLLPKVLYVDPTETVEDNPMAGTHRVAQRVDDGAEAFLTLEGAIRAAEALCKRVPSAAEYEAIVEWTRHRTTSRTSPGKAAIVEGLLNGLAEWTTTKYDFSGSGAHALASLRYMSVLKGYGEMIALPEMLRSPDGELLSPSDFASPRIGWRGVRSGAPRFVQP